ncbi:MAG: polyphosphate polymerase domain-containing protein [Anaerolineales bacterium]|nr:polyphosphate polymerase domain-containing protein [Anaerolineales bacterium]
MNHLSHTIRKFNRFELKYLVTLQQAERIKAGLRAYLAPDEHGNNNGRYALASLYYDSPDYHCYWEKVDGIRFRRKLRIRRYETGEALAEGTPVFLEIKQRIDRVTQKRRAILPYRDALRLCNERQLPDCAEGDRATVEEIFAFLWQYNLRPASIVRYERQAFIGSEYDIGLRVTFDTNLTYQAHRLLLHEEPSGLPMFAPNCAVMEVKANERIPYWLTNLLAAHNLGTVRVSKYCRSIELAQRSLSAQRRIAAFDWSQSLFSSASRPVFHALER